MLDTGLGEALVARALAGIRHRRDDHPGVGQIQRGLDAGIVGTHHHGLFAGRDPKLVHQAAGGASQHHAGAIVARKHQRLLDSAAGKHDLARRGSGASCRPGRRARGCPRTSRRRRPAGGCGRPDRGRDGPVLEPSWRPRGRSRRGARPEPGPRPPAPHRGLRRRRRWQLRGRPGLRRSPVRPRADAPSRTGGCGDARGRACPGRRRCGETSRSTSTPTVAG